MSPPKSEASEHPTEADIVAAHKAQDVELLLRYAATTCAAYRQSKSDKDKKGLFRTAVYCYGDAYLRQEIPEPERKIPEYQFEDLLSQSLLGDGTEKCGLVNTVFNSAKKPKNNHLYSTDAVTRSFIKLTARGCCERLEKSIGKAEAHASNHSSLERGGVDPLLEELHVDPHGAAQMQEWVEAVVAKTRQNISRDINIGNFGGLRPKRGEQLNKLLDYLFDWPHDDKDTPLSVMAVANELFPNAKHVRVAYELYLQLKADLSDRVRRAAGEVDRGKPVTLRTPGLLVTEVSGELMSAGEHVDPPPYPR